jgi:hypothetical protein
MLCITEKVSRKACETTCAQEGLPLLVCIGRIYVVCVIFVYFFSSSHTYAFTWAAGAGGKISRDFFFRFWLSLFFPLATPQYLNASDHSKGFTCSYANEAHRTAHERRSKRRSMDLPSFAHSGLLQQDY